MNDKTIFTVYFEDPFWVGIAERYENGKLYVAKHTFGGEPTNAQIEEFSLGKYDNLQFSPAVESFSKEEIKNPKRRIRQARKSMTSSGIGTKSQTALKLQHELNKETAAKNKKRMKFEKKQAAFIQKQEKKKQKHKGH